MNYLQHILSRAFDYTRRKPHCYNMTYRWVGMTAGAREGAISSLAAAFRLRWHTGSLNWSQYFLSL